MYNVRRTKATVPTDMVSINTVREIVSEITNPKTPTKKVIEGDGLAFKSYCFNIFKKKHNG